jgi:hypothetical protein
MKIVHRAWLLSHDEHFLKKMCLACFGLAMLSYLMAGLEAAGPPDTPASYERIQLASDSRFVSP